MSWQKCPICGGSGMVGIGFPTGQICKVCNGFGIINEQTGEPLKYQQTYTSSSENPTAIDNG